MVFSHVTLLVIQKCESHFWFILYLACTLYFCFVGTACFCVYFSYLSVSVFSLLSNKKKKAAMFLSIEYFKSLLLDCLLALQTLEKPQQVREIIYET